MKKVDTRNIFKAVVKLKATELQKENAELEQMIADKKIEVTNFEDTLDSIKASRIFWIWQLYGYFKKLIFKEV